MDIKAQLSSPEPDYLAYFHLSRQPFEGFISVPADVEDLRTCVFEALREVGGPGRELFREAAVERLQAVVGPDADRLRLLVRASLVVAAATPSLVIGADIVNRAAVLLGRAGEAGFDAQPDAPAAVSRTASRAASKPVRNAARVAPETTRRRRVAGVRGFSLAIMMLALIGLVIGFGTGALFKWRGSPPTTPLEADPNGGAPVGLRLSESLANSPESEAEREANAREAMRQNAGRLGAALGSLLPAPEPEAADDVRSD